MSSNNSPNNFTFLVLADIHFGDSDDSPEFNVSSKSPKKKEEHRKNRLQHLIDTAKKEKPAPSAVLVLGDLTSSALPSEFIECKELVYQIAKELNINDDRVFFTYGNHDIDWRICKLAQMKEHRYDKYYNHVAATIGSVFWEQKDNSTSTPPRIEAGPIVGSGVFKIDDHRVFVLNSGWACTNDQDFPHGYLGSEQFQWIQQALKNHKSSNGWNIVISHHHAYGYAYPSPCQDISCLEEGADLLQLMGEEGVDMFCHGHRHHAIAETTTKSTWKNPITFFCAGSVAANSKERAWGKLPNLFHIVSLNERSELNAAIGYIKSYKYGLNGWDKIQHTPDTPLNYEHWFGIPTAVQELDKNIRAFLLQYTQRNSNGEELPILENLPLNLKCCPLPILNEKAKNMADSLGYRLMGKWGEKENVGLIKRT